MAGPVASFVREADRRQWRNTESGCSMTAMGGCSRRGRGWSSTIAVVSLLAFGGPASADEPQVQDSAKRRACAGTINGKYFSFRVTAVRSIPCRNAKRGARRYERDDGMPRNWLCSLARRNSRGRLFSCAVRIRGRYRDEAVLALRVRQRGLARRSCGNYLYDGPGPADESGFIQIRTRGVKCGFTKRLMRATASRNTTCPGGWRCTRPGGINGRSVWKRGQKRIYFMPVG